MAKDGNKVHMTARLGADPEMKYTSNGKAVTELRVAVAGAGNTFDDAGWFSCTAWDKLAEICNQYLTKGIAGLHRRPATGAIVGR
jgi:single-strand DNA-binding protein